MTWLEVQYEKYKEGLGFYRIELFVAHAGFGILC